MTPSGCPSISSRPGVARSKRRRAARAVFFFFFPSHGETHLPGRGFGGVATSKGVCNTCHTCSYAAALSPLGILGGKVATLCRGRRRYARRKARMSSARPQARNPHAPARGDHSGDAATGRAPRPTRTRPRPPTRDGAGGPPRGRTSRRRPQMNKISLLLPATHGHGTKGRFCSTGAKRANSARRRAIDRGSPRGSAVFVSSGVTIGRGTSGGRPGVNRRCGAGVLTRARAWPRSSSRRSARPRLILIGKQSLWQSLSAMAAGSCPHPLHVVDTAAASFSCRCFTHGP